MGRTTYDRRVLVRVQAQNEKTPEQVEGFHLLHLVGAIGLEPTTPTMSK